MPSYLVNGHHDAPLEIPGTDGRKVTFKAAASFGDDLHCDVVAAQYAPESDARLSEDDRRRASERRTHAYVLARTVAMIVSWDLEDEAGQPLPIVPQSLVRLSKEAGGFLATQARIRFEGRPEEEERPFESPSPRPSPAARPTTPK